MNLRIETLVERLRASLFFIPMTAVFTAIIGGSGILALDGSLQGANNHLPSAFTSTVESARIALGAIAGATISFAGIAFSVSLLIIQQTSNQFSPRVVQTMFRDPFNKRVMALVVGTFTYTLLVLRWVQAAGEGGGNDRIPHISIIVAMVLGVATILATVAFIDHSAHSMDVSEILDRIETAATEQLRSEWVEASATATEQSAEDASVQIERVQRAVAADEHGDVRFSSSGWVTQIDLDMLVAAVDPGSTIRLDTYPGRYGIEGTLICVIVPRPENLDEVSERICGALALADTRTMQQDVSYGLRQLSDIALKALSPGINDPTTAQDAIFHSAAVLAEAFRRDPPPKIYSRSENRGAVQRMADAADAPTRLILTQRPDHSDLTHLAFDETRWVARGQATVCIYLLEALKLVTESTEALGLHRRVDVLHAVAKDVVAGCEMAELLPSDLAAVRAAYEKRFAAS